MGMWSWVKQDQEINYPRHLALATNLDWLVSHILFDSLRVRNHQLDPAGIQARSTWSTMLKQASSLVRLATS